MNETLKPFNGDSYLWKEYGSIENYTGERTHSEGFIGPIPGASRKNFFVSSGCKRLLEEGHWDQGCPRGTDSTLAMPWWMPGGADFIIWCLRRGEGTSILNVSINFF